MAIYGQEALNNCHHPVEYLVALVQGIGCLCTLLLSHTGAVLLGIQKYVILCTHFENGALFCSMRGNLKM